MRDRKSNIAPSFTVMHVALLLLCAVLLTAHATTGLYASYKSEASGSDSAHVARFDVTAECAYDEATDTYTLTIINNSEVTVEYSITYSVDGAALPNGIDIVFAHGNGGTLPQGRISGKLNITGEYTGTDPLNIDISVTATQVD